MTCQHCGQLAAHLRRGRCPACFEYQRRTGEPRPARLYAGGPRRCVNCAAVVQPGAGRRCFPCAIYRRRHGVERPAALYRRGRCTCCGRCLSLFAPSYQTLCYGCADMWNDQMAAEVSA